MSFETPTLEEQHAEAVELFKALFPDADVSERSFNWLWALTQSGGVTDNHAHIDSVADDLMPDTADDDAAVRWATIRGVVRKGATGARKAKALRVVGTPTTAVDAELELEHESTGYTFKITTGDTVGPDGYVDVDVAAISTGAATRLDAGQTLRFVGGPPAGIEEEAELQLDLDEDGTDLESIASLKERTLSRFSSPPLGGAQEDYEQWALEETGIADAYCYPLRNGAGTVDLVALHEGTGTARVLTAPEIAELQALIDEKRPVSVRAFRVLAVTTTAEDVTYTYLPDGAAEHEPDWDDSTPPAYSAWNAGTRKLTFTTDRPASMKAGDRIVQSNGATGAERVIESLDGTDAVILEDDPDGDTPGASAVFYSGGPIVQPIRQAIQDLIDNLGTANPDANRYGTWEGNLRPSAIGRVASAVEGVLDGTVVLPAATVEASDPEYPDNDEIELIIAGRILVRAQ